MVRHCCVDPGGLGLTAAVPEADYTELNRFVRTLKPPVQRPAAVTGASVLARLAGANASFFMSEREVALFEEGDEPALFMSPSVHVSRDKLMTAIEQVERLCEWLEEKLFDAKYPARILRD